MSKCELCDESGYYVWKCSICNKTPLCAKHVVIQRDGYGMFVMFCYECIKPKMKHHKPRRTREDELIIAQEAKKRIIAEFKARKKFDKWLLDNPNWEAEEHESYMRKAEEKFVHHINKLKSEKPKAYVTHYRNSGGGLI